MHNAATLLASRRPWRRGEMLRLGVTAITVAATLAAATAGTFLRLTSDISWADDQSVPDSPVDGAGLSAALPVSVRIRAIGLQTDRIVGLGRAPSGAMEVPAGAATVGLLRNGVTPGEVGAAVLAGHRRLGHARGAFDAVDELQPGDTITVAGEDGEAATFTVYRVAHTVGVPSAVRLATEPTGRPELRLITWAEHTPGGRAEARSVVVLAATPTIAARQPITTGS